MEGLPCPDVGLSQFLLFAAEIVHTPRAFTLHILFSICILHVEHTRRTTLRLCKTIKLLPCSSLQANRLFQDRRTAVPVPASRAVKVLSLSQGRTCSSFQKKTTEHRERILPGSDQCLPDPTSESTLWPDGKVCGTCHFFEVLGGRRGQGSQRTACTLLPLFLPKIGPSASVCAQEASTLESS